MRVDLECDETLFVQVVDHPTSPRSRRKPDIFQLCSVGIDRSLPGCIRPSRVQSKTGESSVLGRRVPTPFQNVAVPDICVAESEAVESATEGCDDRQVRTARGSPAGAAPAWRKGRVAGIAQRLQPCPFIRVGLANLGEMLLHPNVGICRPSFRAGEHDRFVELLRPDVLCHSILIPQRLYAFPLLEMSQRLRLRSRARLELNRRLKVQPAQDSAAIVAAADRAPHPGRRWCPRSPCRPLQKCSAWCRYRSAFV